MQDIQVEYKLIVGSAIAEYIYQNGNNRVGFDGYECEMKDLVEGGILDATKVVKVSLINAASVAMMLLTTDSLVIFEHEPIINPLHAKNP